MALCDTPITGGYISRFSKKNNQGAVLGNLCTICNTKRKSKKKLHKKKEEEKITTIINPDITSEILSEEKRKKILDR